MTPSVSDAIRRLKHELGERKRGVYLVDIEDVRTLIEALEHLDDDEHHHIHVAAMMLDDVGSGP